MIPKSHEWTKRYAPIPQAKLREMIGKPLHLAWASGPGFQWILEAVVGDNLYLHTPVSKKRIKASAKDALYTKKQMQELGINIDPEKEKQPCLPDMQY